MADANNIPAPNAACATIRVESSSTQQSAEKIEAHTWVADSTMREQCLASLLRALNAGRIPHLTPDVVVNEEVAMVDRLELVVVRPLPRLVLNPHPHLQPNAGQS